MVTKDGGGGEELEISGMASNQHEFLDDEEFTLSMDLPRRPSPEAAVRKRPGLNVRTNGDALLPDRMDGWITSGLPDDGVLQCR